MKKDEIIIGETYIAKVSNKKVRVRILSENPNYKGWYAINLETRREVTIKTAARLTPIK